MLKRLVFRWDIFDLLELNITSSYLNFDNVSLQSSITL